MLDLLHVMKMVKNYFKVDLQAYFTQLNFNGENRMIIEESKLELIEFLEKHPNADFTCITTIKDGYVSCIKPIKTICGAEVHCSSKTYRAIQALGII